MRIIDNVKRPGFTQWCPDFVKRVIESTHMIICGNRVDTVEITEITDKRIYLSISGLPFIIRTWNYIPCEKDRSGKTCGERVDFTLFFAGEEYTFPNGLKSGNGVPMTSGALKIKWSNSDAIYQREVEEYNRLHGIQ